MPAKEDGEAAHPGHACPSVMHLCGALHRVRLRLQLAKVYWTLGDHASARHLLREIDAVLIHRPALGVLVDEVAEFRRIVTSSAQLGTTGEPHLSPA